MLVRIIDLVELENRHAYWGISRFPATNYNVLAIRCWKKKQYLVEDNMILNWWDADLFKIIDDAIPQEWVTIQYKSFHKYKNPKYNFKIPTTYYQGPKKFLDNQDFFFDIYENPGVAYDYYKSIYKI